MRQAAAMAVVAFGLSFGMVSSAKAESTPQGFSATKNVRAKVLAGAEMKRVVGGEDGTTAAPAPVPAEGRHETAKNSISNVR